jgi:adenylosuccinate synthase
MNNVVVVQGMQFGSEAKGSIAGLIAKEWGPDTVVCANHPNAGHTFIDEEGNKFVHRILPIGAQSNSVKFILIGPGAVIDLVALVSELQNLAHLGLLAGKTLCIHPNAAVLLVQHAEAEKRLVTIGSTMKGSMEAVVNKMRRPADPLERNTVDSISRFTHMLAPLYEPGFRDFRISLYDDVYDRAIDASHKLLVEGAQGFSLGIHGPFYPYGTSRDVSTHQVLADCRIPHLSPTSLTVVGVARTYPIRVANRFDETGKQIGTSGPHYPDQEELAWKNDLNREPELTTVTKLPRRVFTFSYEQIRESARVMGVDYIALTFCDYLFKDHGLEVRESGALSDRLMVDIDKIEEMCDYDSVVKLVSFGPGYKDMYERFGKIIKAPSLEFLP